MELRPGLRLKSVVCDTAVIVVRAAGGDVDLRCGGHPMVPFAEKVVSRLPVTGDAPATIMGKRYTHDGTELLCTKAGEGGLSIAGVPVGVAQASALPSSD
ncbi:MAG: hypothetical protein OJJ54_24430 [Pseudonocardia sp.]|nr:hypothetical protein [Pseudonocardia sp.]